MKKSPFTLLCEAIESEIFNTSLLFQSHFSNNEQINLDFVLGYIEALKFLKMKSDFISRYGRSPKF